MSRTGRPDAPWHYRRDDRDPGLVRKPSASKRVYTTKRTGRTPEAEREWQR